MIARIALAAGVALVIAALALRHPAPQSTIQSLSVATANAGGDASYSAAPRHRSRRAAPPDELVVYVAGAVKRPGLYQLKYGDRYERAVALAGGLAPSADAAGVNLAERVADGEEIYVPLAGET
ncbi:MAG: SLBB domain-containing protein, partial [Candidatus Cybelea sp.]